MKTIIIFILCFVAASLADDDWEEFKLQHEKVYADPSEENYRYEVFQNNLKEIEEHNKLFDAGEVSWEQGITPFTDMTKEEFIAFLNLTGPLEMPEDSIPFDEDSELEVPAKINWRTKGKVSGVKDQKSCGSCWAFSTTGAIESQLLIRGRNYLLSEQQLVDCSTANNGCNGGSVNKAFDYVKKYGLEHQKYYPYRAKKGKCAYNKSKVATRLRGYRTGKNENTLKQLVGQYGPTSVYIDASHFQNYKSGVFDTNKCSQRVNHAVLVVGYDREKNRDYWLVKNSWGGRWGDRGYVKMARGKKLCAIGNYDFIPSL